MKILKVVGIVVVVGVAALVAALLFAHREGAKRQEAFFEAVLSGEVDRVKELLYPTVLEQIDDPMLEAWMKLVRRDLGAYRGLSGSDWETSTATEQGVTRTKTRGKVLFEKGEARSELVFVEGKILSFDVESDTIDFEDVEALLDLEPYRLQARALLEALFRFDADRAWELTSEKFRKGATLEQIRGLTERLEATAGPLVELSDGKPAVDIVPDGVSMIRVAFDVKCERWQTRAVVDFQVIGLKAWLLSFDVTADD